MSDLLLGVSPELLYYQGSVKQVSSVHAPYFLAFPCFEDGCGDARRRLLSDWQKHKDQDVYSKIRKIGPVERYRSFADFHKSVDVFRVYTTESFVVPEVSDFLFFQHNLCTAEHDIPYQQRAVTDLASSGKGWIFDTHGDNKTMKVLVYDIETTQFGEGKTDVPIDMIGYASFEISLVSRKDIASESFAFDIVRCPDDWQGIDISQVMATNLDEEIKQLVDFVDVLSGADIVSGHNILGFDNAQLYDRLHWIQKKKGSSLSSSENQKIQSFLSRHLRVDRSFHFGVGSQVVQFYPSSFDTYLAARKFYPFLDDFSLKAIAPFLGIHLKNRLLLTPSQIKLDAQTQKYNLQDVQEQLGVTLHLIQQALPLAFTTCMPFDMLLPAGAVNIWDHMAMIRAGVQKKMMPPICRVKSVAQTLVREYKGCTTKKEIVQRAKTKRDQLSKEFRRIVKYGQEMPQWVLYPYVIYHERAKDSDEQLGYHMPGGMTIKPDKDAQSHFIPWYHVVVADVGAMYPTILKAKNLGADTVRLAQHDETPDAWVWMKRLPIQFSKNQHLQIRPVSQQDAYADIGWMIGICIDKKPGVVNQAMTGIMNMISRVKEELKEAESKHHTEELTRLRMMYQSLKGARNAGTHGILSAPMVTGRQFNVWGAAAITTIGQMILSDTLRYLEKQHIRVVYGDTDGIYLGCSKSMGNTTGLPQALGVSLDEDATKWITKPEKALAGIEQCNRRWQRDLNYPEFELEPETHDGMLFVKHKNYLIFDSKQDRFVMTTKGNNFKGSDKANIARKALDQIMREVLRENPVWSDESKARETIRESIRTKTQEVVSSLDLSEVDLDDLTLIQSVQPAKRYKLNQDGSMSTFGKRAQALEKLLGHPIRSRVKLKFVVTKQALPGIVKPSKSGVKPIDFMYPVDLVKDRREIDLSWYKKMIENYIQGAFGLSDVRATEQKGLDDWM